MACYTVSMDQSQADKILADSRAGYAAIGDETALTRDVFYWEEFRRFVDYMREGESVLDVGCGNGRVYEFFTPKKISYAGVDVSPLMIDRARELWKEKGPVFEVGDVMSLPVPDGRYDVVIAAGILQHVPSLAYRRQAMSELARAVRPGGYILIADWNLWRPRYWKTHLHQRFGRANGWEPGDLKISWKKSGFPRYFRAFTRNELRALAASAGMRVVEQYYTRKGELANWLTGENLVTICRKPDTKKAGA